MIKQFLTNLISDKTKKGKIFNLTIICLIVLSIVSFSIETLPGLDQKVITTFQIIELIIVIIFSIELLLRILFSEQKFRYIFSFYGIVDLLAILPFYLATGIDLRTIRAVRLLRIFRILKLVKYSKAIQRYKNAFLTIKTELTLFLFASIILLYTSAVGIYYFENEIQPDKF